MDDKKIRGQEDQDSGSQEMEGRNQQAPGKSITAGLYSSASHLLVPALSCPSCPCCPASAPSRNNASWRNRCANVHRHGANLNRAARDP